jgi:peptidoglycan/xylan/chitin deacetylase (PgdA/CDA1 family)
VPILMYHEIAASPQTASRLAVPVAAFAAQLAHLHAAGFTAITAADFAAALAGGTSPPERSIVITFDDGYADFHDLALPLLLRYGFTATVFVTAGWIQDAGPDSADGRPGTMLSWSQIMAAADAGIEIGAHSYRHPELDQMPGHQVWRELADSKAMLEDGLMRPVPGLAYPFGYSNSGVRRAARDIGHQYACAVGNAVVGPRWDPFALPRLTVRRSTSLRAFSQAVRGQRLPLSYLGDRSLTAGWSVVRRTRAALRGVSRDA